MTEQAIFQTALTSLALDKMGGRSQRTSKEVWRSRQAAKSNAPTDRLKDRANLGNMISEMQRDGMVAVQIDEIETRDSSAVLIPATVMSYVKFERDIYSDPDALVTITPISDDCVRDFYPELEFNNNQ